MKLEDLDVVTYEILESIFMQYADVTRKLKHLKVDISIAKMLYQRYGTDDGTGDMSRAINKLDNELVRYNDDLNEIEENFKNACSNAGCDFIDMFSCFTIKYPKAFRD